MSKKLIRFDWAVSNLLRDKAGFPILEGFLSQLLHDDIRIEKIYENREQKGANPQNRIDMRTRNAENEIVVVDIQNMYDDEDFRRMPYGGSPALSENFSPDRGTEEIKKMISIGIAYFDLGQGDDYIYKSEFTLEGLHQKDKETLTSAQDKALFNGRASGSFREYYLIRLNQFNDVVKNGLDEWVYFLKNSEVRDDFKAKGLKEAREALDVMRLPPEAEYGYNRYLDSLHVKASEMMTLRMEAEDRVRIAEMTKVVKNAVDMGLDDAYISKLTQLDVEQIKEIRSNLGKE